MTKFHTPPSIMNRHKQHGVALAIALILLVIMTLLGLSGVRTVGLEEKMASNTYDRSLAFQAAEAALRAGEDAAQAQSVAGNAGFPVYVDADNTCPAAAINTCNAGLCARPDKDCEARWTAATFNWINSTASAAVLNLGPLAGGVPRYFIEYLGNNYPNDPDDPNSCSGGPGSPGCTAMRYRVTAISNTGAGRAGVILQSIYAPQ